MSRSCVTVLFLSTFPPWMFRCIPMRVNGSAVWLVRPAHRLGTSCRCNRSCSWLWPAGCSRVPADVWRDFTSPWRSTPSAVCPVTSSRARPWPGRLLPGGKAAQGRGDCTLLFYCECLHFGKYSFPELKSDDVRVVFFFSLRWNTHDKEILNNL